MDDSKTLTLPNAERILLNPTMRLVFESENLKHATPATVSRAGIIFINADDIGWWPLVTSWIARWEHQSMQQVLNAMFVKYLFPLVLKKYFIPSLNAL
jgi:dynein heavy chain